MKIGKKEISIGLLLKRVFCYFFGLLIIAVGINLSKIASLGISPVSSVPRACEVLLGEKTGLTLGAFTFIVYCILVLLQILVLRKQYRPFNLLSLALTFVFSWMVDLVGIDPNAFGHLLAWMPRPENYFLRLAYLVVSILLIGFGVFLHIRPKWVTLPAEGLAAAISQKTGKAFGDCKTAVDCSLITIALILQIAFLGGFSSFTSDQVIVREGTICAAVCVGQVVKLLNKLIGKPLDRWVGKGEEK